MRARIIAKSSAARGRVKRRKLFHPRADRHEIIGSSGAGHVSSWLADDDWKLWFSGQAVSTASIGARPENPPFPDSCDHG
jgi:hypothetical protein